MVMHPSFSQVGAKRSDAARMWTSPRCGGAVVVRGAAGAVVVRGAGGPAGGTGPAPAGGPAQGRNGDMTTLADFTATTISGRPQPLAEHLGSVVLVVNTASRCGLTPQYAGLQALHERYGDRGLRVLGFPCDQFMHQEPGTEA